MLLNGNSSGRNISTVKVLSIIIRRIPGFLPPPDGEETENDREDNEDVEDAPARKSSRR